MNPTVREPAVAGTFYPARPAELRRTVEGFLAGVPREERRPRLLLAPHAGYTYSGAIAAEGYGRLAPPRLAVVLAPNHYGIGAPLALPSSGAWRTPLGDLALAADVARAITVRLKAFRDDWRAHSRDHALEVQLPFLQAIAERAGAPPPRIVTIACGTQDLRELVSAGEAIAEGLRDAGLSSADDALLVVSSDMSHYIPAREARELDLPVLAHVTAIEPERVHAEVHGKGISMCGVAPAVAGLAAARTLGAGKGELIRYGHSGEVTGDDASVVAYATVIVP